MSWYPLQAVDEQGKWPKRHPPSPQDEGCWDVALLGCSWKSELAQYPLLRGQTDPVPRDLGWTSTHRYNGGTLTSAN